MSQNTEPKKERSAKGAQTLSGDSVMIIRLVAAAVIFAVTLIVSMSGIVSFILRAIAAAIACYDIALNAVDEVNNKKYFSRNFLLLIIVVVSFVIKYSWEGTAVVILYQLSGLIIGYVAKRTKESATELMKNQDENIIEKTKALIEEKDAGRMKLEDEITSAADSVLKCGMIFAVVFAILLPIFTNFSAIESIHRALTILVVCTPASVVFALPYVGITGMCYGAGKGIIFKNAAILEKLHDIKTAVFDKTGIFTSEAPQMLSAESDVFPNSTFMTLAAHAVYYSEQPVAKAITAQYTDDYKLDIISDFNDIPGFGVELRLAGSKMILAKKEYYDSIGIEVNEAADYDGQIYYAYYSDRFIGIVVLSSDFNADSANLCAEMKDNGIEKTILLTEDGKKESEETAVQLGFDSFYSQCTPIKKKDVIRDISDRRSNKVMFIYASSIESHSDANVDIRVARKGKYADALVVPEELANLPIASKIGKRSVEIAEENAIFAFIVKAFLIFLSINGWCTMWFAVFMDSAAVIATLLNTIRVTNDSLIEKVMSKRGRDNE